MGNPLTAERLRTVLKYDLTTGIFWRDGAPVGCLFRRRNRDSYWLVGIDGKQYYAHRLAWFYVTGEWPDQIDHINRNGLDNRWANLRLATCSQNRVNASAQKHSRSKHRGIHRISSGRYRVQLQKDGKSIHVGYFASMADAVLARDVAARRVHGEFAYVEDRSVLL